METFVSQNLLLDFILYLSQFDQNQLERNYLKVLRFNLYILFIHLINSQTTHTLSILFISTHSKNSILFY